MKVQPEIGHAVAEVQSAYWAGWNARRTSNYNHIQNPYPASDISTKQAWTTGYDDYKRVVWKE